MDFFKRYEYWLSSDSIDEKDKEELRSLKGNQKEIEDRFFKDLSFWNRRNERGKRDRNKQN